MMHHPFDRRKDLPEEAGNNGGRRHSNVRVTIDYEEVVH